jgi:hypothetical protein
MVFKGVLLMNELVQRVTRVAESILENERLTADLDDAAAKVLLDWGVACAEMIAQSTAGLNNLEAEEVMYPRLRATRRLMRSVNKWIAKQLEMDDEGSATLLAKIIKQAAIIYGESFMPPDNDRRNAFLRQQAEVTDNPPQIIANLRELLENLGNTSLANHGEK